MREYFLNLLQNLDKFCGLKQYEKIMQLPTHKEELNALLDILCRVSEQFKFIPEKDQKRIISDAVITDQEFQGLNARVIYKWLNLKKDQFFTEAAHMPTEPTVEPVTGEARDKWLKKFMEAVMSVGAPETKPVNPYKEVQEQWKAPEGEHYKPMDSGEAFLKAAHIEYLKAMKDTPKDQWPDEMQWVEENYIIRDV